VSRRRKIKRVYDVSLAKVVTNRGYIGNERLGVTNGVENINTNETDHDAEPANCRKSNRRLRLAAPPPLKLHVPHAMPRMDFEFRLQTPSSSSPKNALNQRRRKRCYVRYWHWRRRWTISVDSEKSGESEWQVAGVSQAWKPAGCIGLASSPACHGSSWCMLRQTLPARMRGAAAGH